MGGGGFHAEPDTLFQASAGFLGARRFVEDIVAGLVGDLAGSGGMAGDDHAGHAFAGRYQPAAAQTTRAMGIAGAGLGSVAGRLLTMAWNYLKTEDAVAGAMNGGRIDTASPTRPSPSQDDCDPGAAHHRLPEVIGRHNWVVNHLIAPFWPEGDPDRLRQAAGRWSKAASLIGQAQGDARRDAQSVVSACHGGAIDAFSAFARDFTEDSGVLGQVRHACDQLAAACQAYARRIEDQRNHLKHLLEAAGVVTVAGGLLTVVTFGVSDGVAAGVDEGIAAAAAASVLEFSAAVETDAAAAALAEAEETVAAAAARIQLELPSGIAAPAIPPVSLSPGESAGTSLAGARPAAFTTGIDQALNPPAVGPIPPREPPFSPLLSPGQQQVAQAWMNSLPSRPAAYGTPDDQEYQRRMAGDTEREMAAADGATTVWADGFRSQDGAIIDAKNVRKKGCSPRTLDKVQANDRAAGFLVDKDAAELRRYGQVLEDPHNKANFLEIDTNDDQTVGYWQFLAASERVRADVRYQR